MEFIQINLNITPYKFIFRHKSYVYEIEVTPTYLPRDITISDIKEIIKQDTEFQDELKILKLKDKTVNDETVNDAVDKAFDGGKIFANPPVKDDRNTQTAPVKDDRNTQTAPVKKPLGLKLTMVELDQRYDEVTYNIEGIFNGEEFSISGDNGGFRSFYSEPTIFIDDAKVIISSALSGIEDHLGHNSESIIEDAIKDAFENKKVKLLSRGKEIANQTNESRKMIGKIIKEEVVKFLRRHR